MSEGVLDEGPREGTRPPLGAGARPRVVLLAEDEPLVRDVTARLLRSFGYAVLEAEDGAAALALAASYPGPIDLLLTDIVMPHLDGTALAARLAEQRPAMPVVFMSGYAGPGAHVAARIDPGTPFLGKPFTPQALRRAVAAALG